MRKSFRLQPSDWRRELSFVTNQEHEGANLMGQLGSGAARLLRGVYTRGQRASSRPLEATDQSGTSGSFRVLSANNYGQFSDKFTGRARAERLKSNAELEIEQRLRRSKRRILPSASYLAPDCERACDGLNMEHLEQIKRDNLRLTLRARESSSREQLGPVESVGQRNGSEEDINLLAGQVCSCTSIGCGDQNSPKANYCSCASISSSFSSLNQQLGSLSEQLELEPASGAWLESGHEEQEGPNKGLQSEDELASESRAAGGGFEVGAERGIGRREGEPVCGTSALGGRGGREISVSLGNVCGKSAANSEISLFSCGDTLSPTTKQDNSARLISKKSGFELENKSKLESKQVWPLNGEQPMEGDGRKLGGARLVQLAGKQVRGACDGMQTFANKCEPSCSALLRERQAQAVDAIELAGAASATSAAQASEQVGGSPPSGQSELLAPAKEQRLNHRRTTDFGFRRRESGNGSGERKEDLRSKFAESKRLRRREIMLSLLDSDPIWRDWRGQLGDSGGALRGERESSMEACEDHLYASICNFQTSSPDRHPNASKEENATDEPCFVPKWHQLRGDYDCAERKLFDKQLENAKQPSNSQAIKTKTSCSSPASSVMKSGNKPRRSLFNRLKHLIAPASKGTCQRVSADGREWPESSDESAKLGPASRSMQKSGTLGARSGQTLFANSKRYLSTSRKSINALAFEEREEATDKFALRKSLVSGFLTLGRRSNASAINNCANSTNQLMQIFGPADQQVVREARRKFGSMDSLPSADSGLSCSNLQNSTYLDDNYPSQKSSVNLYSGGPLAPNRKRDELAAKLEPQARVVGRARAKVDCNPCAYDKEALVFKQGDLIDILERHQSGTWVGRCGNQVGHFKFINVTELPEQRQDEYAADEQRAGVGGDRCLVVQTGDCAPIIGGADNTGRLSGGRLFITKLEIKSNRGNNEQGFGFEQSSIGQGDCSRKTTDSPPTINRRSNSVNTIESLTDQVERADCENGGGDLGSSNETIMSSLEQLLFAIGLAGEQASSSGCNKTRNQKTDAGADVARLNEPSDIGTGERCSYLSVLNRGGINNLDSFSAINDLHELEQIGIVDDEHQRRLLMAARIIRQASRAAKLDFVESYRTRSNGGGGGQLTANVLARNSLTRKPELDGRRKETTNEPIYVNLPGAHANKVSSFTQSIGAKQRSLFKIQDPDLVANHDYQPEQVGPATGSRNAAVTSLKSPLAERALKDHRPEQPDSPAGRFNSRVGTGRPAFNATNQSDCYRSGCPQNSEPDLAHQSDWSTDDDDYDDDHDDYDDDDDDDDDDNDVAGHDKDNLAGQRKLALHTMDRSRGLDMGYSVRVEGRTANSGLDLARDTGPRCAARREGGAPTCAGERPSRLITQSNLKQKPHQKGGRNPIHCDTRATRGDVYAAEGSRKSVHLPAIHYYSDQSNMTTGPRNAYQQQESLASNFRSQVNSKSAYDLRLDLSHFFS